MKIEAGTLEKVFIPVLSGISLSVIGGLFNFHTQIKVLETKVEVNNERIQKLFNRLDQLRMGQKEILKMLGEFEYRKDRINRIDKTRKLF